MKILKTQLNLLQREFDEQAKKYDLESCLDNLVKQCEISMEIINQEAKQEFNKLVLFVLSNSIIFTLIGYTIGRYVR